MNSKKIAVLVGICVMCAIGMPARAQSVESIDQFKVTLLNLIRALVDQGVLTAGKAQDMLRQAGLDPALLNGQVTQVPAPSAEAPKPVVRVPYVPETVKDEMRNEIRQEVLAQAHAERWGDPGALPEWLSRFNVYGDMRIRYQREDYPSENSVPQAVDAWYQLPFGTTRNSQTSRQQELVRARAGFDAQMGENFVTQLRVVAVNGDTLTASPVTYNVDEASYGRPFSAGIDLANIQWKPLPMAKATLGRMANPYLGSDLIFASDLSFDGIVASVEPQFSAHWSGLFTAGMHPLTSNWVGPYNSASNQWLYAAQLGGKWTAASESKLQFAATYYDYVALEGQLNPPAVLGNTLNALSAPPFRILGNTMFNINWYSDPNNAPAYAYASKFRLVNAFASYELASFDPMHLAFTADWVRNVGFNTNEISKRIQGAVAGLPTDANGLNGIQRPRVTGYRAEFDLTRGDMKHLGSWQLFGGYRYLERDAVPDAFTSLDYRLGGTDQKATFAGVRAALSSRVNMRVSLQSAKSIDAPIKYDIDMWFIDLYGTF